MEERRRKRKESKGREASKGEGGGIVDGSIEEESSKGEGGDRSIEEESSKGEGGDRSIEKNPSRCCQSCLVSITSKLVKWNKKNVRKL